MTNHDHYRVLATLDPLRQSLWHREPRPEDDLAVRLYTVTLEVLRLMGQGWTRSNHRCDIDTFEPAVVRFHLRHWQQLVSSAEATSSPGAEPIGTAGEVDARRTLISIKADLEQGTDEALYTILNWRQAERIYTRQGRHERYLQRLAMFRATWRDALPHEPSSPLAEAVCIERIARALGWYPHTCAEKP